MKYYVQRTMTQIIEVEASDTFAAEVLAMAIDAGDWHRSIDTEIDYIVLDASGTMVTE